MRIKMLTIIAGPEGVAAPGQIIDRPEDEAKLLVAAGYAVSAEAYPTRSAAKPEAAVMEPEDAAVMRKAKGRKGAR